MLMSALKPLAELESAGEFVPRHVGIDADDEARMLSVVGAASRRALICEFAGARRRTRCRMTRHDHQSSLTASIARCPMACRPIATAVSVDSASTSSAAVVNAIQGTNSSMLQ